LDVNEIDGAEYQRHRVDDEEADVEYLLMPRDFLIVGNIKKEFLYVHSKNNYITLNRLRFPTASF
jgi:hypothetical protein